MPSSASKLILVLALVAGSLALAAPPASAVPTKTVKAATNDNSWQPKKVRLVRRNGKGVIKWTNPSFTPHRVQSSNKGTNWSMGTKILETSGTNVVKRTFKKRGTYHFRCNLHQGMVGKVIVR